MEAKGTTVLVRHVMNGPVKDDRPFVEEVSVEVLGVLN